ncbi:MAG TPA: hypothetical protein PLU88_04125, partial [Armatimonadota bacterium]|nr:hypothetical protein [Armatimonadota bacterium]
LVILIALILQMLLSGGKSVTGGDPVAVTGPSVTNAPVIPQGGPSVTNAPAVTPPTGPALPTGPGKQPPPPEVLEYLEFVRQVEAARHTLLKDTGRALSMTTNAKGLENMIGWVMGDDSVPADPLADLKKELGIHLNNWQMLIRHFDTKRPPAACADFAGTYRMCMSSQAEAMRRVSTLVNGINLNSTESMSQALTQLQGMKSDPNLQGNIDQAVESADSKLAELCSRLGIQKPFDVKKEKDVSGSLTGGL